MKSQHLMDGAGASHARGRRVAVAPASVFPRAWHFALEYLVALPVGAGIALTWANLAPESYFRMAGRLAFGVNDVAMVLFFGSITKEIVEAVLPGGLLTPGAGRPCPSSRQPAVVIVPASRTWQPCGSSRSLYWSRRGRSPQLPISPPATSWPG